MELDSDFKTPGQLIQALLDERGWTQRVLAVVLGADESTLNKVIAAKRPIDAEMALSMAEVFQVPAEKFMDLQNTWSLAQARLIARPDPARSARAHLFGSLPVSEMMKRGWIPSVDVRDVASVEAALTTFFRASTPSEIEILPHAAKKTKVSAVVTPIQLAWLYRVTEIAEEILVAKYPTGSAESLLKKLSVLRLDPSDIRKVPRILQEAGIRFVICEALPGSKIDGACFWLDDYSPVIGMSIRYDRIDNFWFVLRHEVEHVIRNHGKIQMVLDTDLVGDRADAHGSVSKEESEANDAASEFCVPKKLMDQFVMRKQPFFAERDILAFAKMLGVHPGIVAGQLQRRTKRWDRFRDHLVTVRQFLISNAIVDGWGDAVPVGEN